MTDIRVLVVDDSAVVRNILSRELSKEQGIEVIATAPDPYVAREKIVKLEPDVVTLDVEMPRMDGITFLSKLMQHYPLPVIILSSLTPSGCATTIKALEIGAVDVMQKPELDVAHKLNEMIVLLGDKIRGAAAASERVRAKKHVAAHKSIVSIGSAMLQTTDKIVAIGASTGGTEAIRAVVPRLPANFPGIVIAQHMPENFTRSFAESLNAQSKMEVREACDNDTVRPGLVLIARGNYHLILRRSGARYYVNLSDGPLVCRQRPSVEVLFESVAKYAGANALGVMLTGMGNDGAAAMKKMKESGAYTIAQSEETCVVFGMPKEAIKAGGVDEVVHLDNIPERLAAKIK